MTAKIDLSQLAVDRPAAAQPKAKRRWFSRYGLPALILLAFTGLLTWAAKDSLLPAHAVTVVPVVVAKAQVQQVDTPLFQAAGWIEPRPIPVLVTSLAEGVIESLHVVAGQRVDKGEVIAKLLEEDARIARDQVRAELRLREAELVAARAELENAQSALAQPVQLQADLAEADSALAKLESQLNALPAEIQAAETKRVLATENIANKENAGSAVAGRVLRTARADFAGINATLQSLEAQQPTLLRQHEALLRKRKALAEMLELKLEEKSRVADAEAGVEAALARRDRANANIQAAELLLSRMTIRSPINGRVLSVQASPGKRMSGLAPHSEQGSSAVVTLYDPRMLQVRVDVRLEDVPQVELGQKARIKTASYGDELQGEVISVTSLADIQKNTLQVKVAILNPPEVLRPEMLGQVTFLAPPRANSEIEQSEDRLRILVPRQLITAGEGGSRVWVADQKTRTARPQEVTLGVAGTEELIEVASGLNPTDKLISGGREGLAEGTRIQITAEDNSIGQPADGSRSALRNNKSQLQ